MSPLRWLLDNLAALRLTRAAIVGDATPPADRREVAKAGGSVRVSPDALWASCRRRSAVLPNRADYDEAAAYLLIAATCGGRVHVIPHPWHSQEEVGA